MNPFPVKSKNCSARFSPFVISVMRFLVVFLSLFQFRPLQSQIATFQKLTAGNNQETGFHTIENNLGYIVAGFTSSSGINNKDACLIQFDKAGNITWQRAYGGANDDKFTLVTFGNDGGYLAMGDTKSTGNGGNDILIVKTDETGGVLWTRTIGGPLDNNAPILGNILNVPGGYIISGQDYSFPGNGSKTATYVVRLSNDGNVQWSKVFESTGIGNYFTATYWDGNILYAGGGADGDACLVKLDLNTGEILSTNRYGGNHLETLYNVRPTSDGNLLLSDASWSPAGGSYTKLWLLKTNKNGDMLWSKTYSIPGVTLRGGATNMPDGGFLLTLYPQPFLSGSYGYLVKTDSEGVVQWARRYSAGSPALFYKAVPTDDGGIIAVGKSIDSNGREHVFLVKTDEGGYVDGCCADLFDITVENFSPQLSAIAFSDSDYFQAENWNLPFLDPGLNPVEVCAQTQPPPSDIKIMHPPCSASYSGEISLPSEPGVTYSFENGPYQSVSVFSGLSAGIYDISAKYPNGCSVRFPVEIIAQDVNLIGNALITSADCSDTITAVIETIGGTPPFQYSLNGGAWVDQNTFNGLSPGIYSLVAKDAATCSDTIIFVVEPKIPISVEITNQQNIDCTHLNAQIWAEANGGSGNYSFQIEPGAPVASGVFTIINPGNYIVTVTDQLGCTAISETITVKTSYDSVTTYANLNLCEGQALQLPGGSSTSTPGIYRFNYIATNGCDSTHIITLDIGPANLYIPNAFHPNDDGKNDHFTVYTNIECIPTVKILQIYDRWGSLLFERFNFSPNDEKLGWDGKAEDRQKLANTGVYVYYCELELSGGAILRRKGDVSLIR